MRTASYTVSPTVGDIQVCFDHHRLFCFCQHLLLPPGHYVCDGRYTVGVPEEPTDRWLFYNDNNVKETTGASVCQNRQRTAYVLFYERQVQKHTF